MTIIPSGIPFKIIVAVFCTISTGLSAQTADYIPGPAGMDTAKFAHLYFFREAKDSFPDNWVGTVIEDHRGLCVKIKMGRIYRVNTLLTGPTRFWSRINNSVSEFTADLQPGKNYYVACNMNGTTATDLKCSYSLLSDSAAGRRLRSYEGLICDRYCELPWPGPHDYLQNLYPDEVSWYASKKYRYRFRALKSWEVILRSPLETTFGFRNQLISETYSEVGGIRYLKLRKCSSEKEFETYVSKKLKQEFLGKNAYCTGAPSVWKTDSVRLPERIIYAKTVQSEVTVPSDGECSQSGLKMCSALVIFYWKDERGKGQSACLYTSERGLEKELHSSDELRTRILACWESFRIADKNQN